MRNDQTANKEGEKMKTFIAEFVGTFVLVFFACGTAVVAGAEVGVLGIALAFGLALIAAAYGIGAVSGCHINPAVSLGAFVAGRLNAAQLVRYVVAQCLGAIVAAIVLLTLAKGALAGYDPATQGLAHNGWGANYGAGYGQGAAFLFELVATFIFVYVILGATGKGAHPAMAGLAIGLTLVVIHLVGIRITGTSVNPARSLGPALMVGGQAIAQLWLFIVAPLIGGALAGLVSRLGVNQPD
jgi:aquaporin Z